MSGIKKPYVGMKFRIPRIGICKIIGIDHDRLCYVVKRGRRKMLVSYTFFAMFDSIKNLPHTVEFMGWIDDAETGLSSFQVEIRSRRWPEDWCRAGVPYD